MLGMYSTLLHTFVAYTPWRRHTVNAPLLVTGPAQGYGMFASSLIRCPHIERLLFGYNRAIDIADKFPNAQVTAVDISPMLSRFVCPHRSLDGLSLPFFSHLTMSTVAPSPPTSNSSRSISWLNPCHGSRVLSMWSTFGSSSYMYVPEWAPSRHLFQSCSEKMINGSSRTHNVS